MRDEHESLEAYVSRLEAERAHLMKAQRARDPRFDLEYTAFEKLEMLGLENTTEGVIALNGLVTAQHMVQAIELPHVTGIELRVIAHHYSQVQVPYADLLRLREYRDADGVYRATVQAVRQLMIAQRDEAQKWLETNPEELVP